jgi:hypothetical protein
MIKRAARYSDWPRCEACSQALPRGLAEERGLVKPVRPSDALCKTYAIERQYQIKRRNGGFV